MESRFAAPLLAASALLALAGCDTTQQISDSGFGAYEVSLATWSDTGVAVVWYDTRDGNAELYMRFIESAGRPIGTDYRLTHTSADSFEPDAATFGQRFALAWYEKGATGALQARLAAWSLDLETVWSVDLGAPGSASRNPVVQATADGLFVAWIERGRTAEELVRAQWFDFDGKPLREPVTLGRASDTTYNLNAAVDRRGVAFVAYDARARTRANELFLAELAPEGVTFTRLTADDGRDSRYPDIKFGEDGTLALTWFDTRDGNEEVYLATGTLPEVRMDAFAHARRVTRTPGESIGAYLAWNGSRLGLVWSDDTEGQHEIYYEPFGPDGAPLGPAQRVTMNPTSSLIPAIKPWRDGFAVAWNEVVPTTNGAHDPETRSEVAFSFVQ